MEFLTPGFPFKLIFFFFFFFFCLPLFIFLLLFCWLILSIFPPYFFLFPPYSWFSPHYFFCWFSYIFIFSPFLIFLSQLMLISPHPLCCLLISSLPLLIFTPLMKFSLYSCWSPPSATLINFPPIRVDFSSYPLHCFPSTLLVAFPPHSLLLSLHTPCCFPLHTPCCFPLHFSSCFPLQFLIIILFIYFFFPYLHSGSPPCSPCSFSLHYMHNDAPIYCIPLIACLHVYV